MKIKLLLTAAFLFSLIGVSHAEEKKPIKVVSTFSIIDDLVKNAGYGNVERHVLVGRNGDAHTFEPTPKDAIILKEADIIFEIGLGFEPWLDDLYVSSKSKAKRIILSEGVDLIRSKDNPNDFDPHIWHDPQNVIIMFKHISNALVAADPAEKQQHMKASTIYWEDLSLLDRWIREELARFPKEKRKLVTSHDTFEYFARAYDFELIGTAINSATTEATDPSAKQMAELIDKIKTFKVKAIFAENTKNPKLLQIIAQEAHVKLGPPLYTDALGEVGSQGQSYISMIRYNVITIMKNLGY